VTPQSSEICQLRLDLDVFDIGETTTTGACTDSFEVTMGSSRTYYPLCGTLTGQHVYLETGRSTSGQTLSFTLATSGASATWRMKVNQVECFSTSKAPSDCFQYFTGNSGIVKSLNYPTVMISLIEYTACVRTELGMCGIQWAPTTTTSPNPFQLDDAIAPALPGESNAVTSEAYIIIPHSTHTYYGGSALSDDGTTIAASLDTANGAVTAGQGPFELTFVSRATSAGVGFNLSYKQLPCNGAAEYRLPTLY